MSKDIYMRFKNNQDVNYNPRIIEYSDILEELVQQIKMTLLTNKGEIIGMPNYGVSLETQIFTLELNNKSLEKVIKNQISLYVPEAQKHGFRCNVKFYKGTVQDICYIDIYLKNQKTIGIII